MEVEEECLKSGLHYAALVAVDKEECAGLSS